MSRKFIIGNKGWFKDLADKAKLGEFDSETDLDFKIVIINVIEVLEDDMVVADSVRMYRSEDKIVYYPLFKNEIRYQLKPGDKLIAFENDEYMFGFWLAKVDVKTSEDGDKIDKSERCVRLKLKNLKIDLDEDGDNADRNFVVRKNKKFEECYPSAVNFVTKNAIIKLGIEVISGSLEAKAPLQNINDLYIQSMLLCDQIKSFIDNCNDYYEKNRNFLQSVFEYKDDDKEFDK